MGWAAENNGEAPAASVPLRVYASRDPELDATDPQLCEVALPALPGGDYAIGDIPDCALPSHGPASEPGPQFLIGHLDPDESLSEAREDDNLLILPYELHALGTHLADLHLPLVLAPEEIQIGEAFSVTLHADNRGEVPSAVARVDVSYSKDRTLDERATPTCSADLPALDTGQTYILVLSGCRLPTAAEPGSASLFAHIDAQDDVPESAEDDNVVELAITVLGTPANQPTPEPDPQTEPPAEDDPDPPDAAPPSRGCQFGPGLPSLTFLLLWGLLRVRPRGSPR